MGPLNNIIFLVRLLITLVGLHAANSVEYTIINTAGLNPGNFRFNNEIGADYSLQTLASAADFIWKVFQQRAASDRKMIEKVSLFIENITGIYTSGSEIHLSAGYIADYSGDVKREITGILYHEATHVWQWNANGEAPRWLIEGIADFVRLRAGYAPSHWVQPGEGSRWDEGYGVTARFLDYLDSLKEGFVAGLNNILRTGDRSSRINPSILDYFQETFGKNIDQLWADYKAKYGT